MSTHIKFIHLFQLIWRYCLFPSMLEIANMRKSSNVWIQSRCRRINERQSDSKDLILYSLLTNPITLLRKIKVPRLTTSRTESLLKIVFWLYFFLSLWSWAQAVTAAWAAWARQCSDSLLAQAGTGMRDLSVRASSLQRDVNYSRKIKIWIMVNAVNIC